MNTASSMRALRSTSPASLLCLMGAIWLAACSVDKQNAVDVTQECLTDDECADDGNPCTSERCREYRCKHDAAPNRAECPGGLCWSGACCQGCWNGSSCDEYASSTDSCGSKGGECLSCDDGDGCTVDACEERSCAHASAADGTSCDNGFPGACLGGQCHCGGAQEPCCPGAQCGDGLSCVSGQCTGCGAQGQACCPGADCGPGLLCSGASCVACGGAGQPCCAGGACDGGALCLGSTCGTCGGAGEACCASGSPCVASGYACVTGSCQACGGKDQPCCAGAECEQQGDECSPTTCTQAVCRQQVLADGLSCGAIGGCRAGACCEGCWSASEAQCDAGTQNTACGYGGALCDNCDDQNDCTVDTCDPSALACTHIEKSEGATCAGGRCSGGQCYTCGTAGTACCAMSLPAGATPCEGASICDVFNGQCLACGGDGQPCCQDGAECEDALVCHAGQCGRCGELGNLCCAGDTCSDTSLACNPYGYPSLCEDCVSSLSVGGQHLCATTLAGVYCAGRYNPDAGSAGTSDVPVLMAMPDGVFPALTVAGGAHSCTLGGTASGYDVWCWGDNTFGQLGAGDTAPSASPRKTTLPSFANPIYPAVGGRHSCAVYLDVFDFQSTNQYGRLFCWGDNTSGQLGLGDLAPRHSPSLVTQNIRFAIAAEAHTCALTKANKLVCWGANDYAQLGLGSATPAAVTLPTEVNLTSPTAFALGSRHTCAVRQQQALCWGGNDSGQLGLPGTSIAPTPSLVQLPGTVAGIAAGRAHTCAIVNLGADQQLYCWGANDSGQLGVGDFTPRAVPAAVPDLTDVILVVAGGDQTCAKHAEGRWDCWGADARGQLGDGPPNQSQSSPVPLRVLCGG